MKIASVFSSNPAILGMVFIIKSVFVRLKQIWILKNLTNRYLIIEVDTPMDSNKKSVEIRPHSHKWAEIC